MRASSYTIYVDLPENQHEMLLVHGYTGAYDKVSRRVATWLRSLETRRAPKPLYGSWTPQAELDGATEPPSENAINTLRRRGYVTEMGVEQEEEVFSKFVNKLHEHNMMKMPTYIFMPTYDCNLRCAYCFQDHMRTDERYRHLLRGMATEVVDRIFSGMKQIEALHQVDPAGNYMRSIGFFGGEPLLAANRPVVEYIISKTLALGPGHFWSVSNATELDAYEDLLGPGKINSVQITLDGPPSMHDQRRIHADGSGSFAQIARNISMALERGAAIDIRMNVDRHNVDQIPALAEAILAHGWDKYPNFSAYTAPVRDEGGPDKSLVSIGGTANGNGHPSGNGNGNGEHRATSPIMDTWELSQAQTAMLRSSPAVSIFEHPDDQIKQHARHLFINPAGASPVLREVFCSAHTGMYIFDAFGDIYTCWDKTGDPSIRLGRITAEGTAEFDQATFGNWRGRTVASNPVCRKCRYALHCGGGCAVLALGKTGKMHMNYCDGFASRLRSGVASAYMDHIAGVPLQAKAARVCDQ